MRQNYLQYSFRFTLHIIVVFGLISILSNPDFLEKIKPVNIFSDIISQPETIIDNFEMAETEPQQPANIDAVPCPDNIQCFENYTTTKFPFDTLISKLLSKKKQVRIAWFGDSFTEADLMVADLRDTLQSLYGGNGVGFVPITYEAPGYRRTLGHQFGGWHTNSFITNASDTALGIAGTVYRPENEAFCKYKSFGKYYKHCENTGRLRIFYTSGGNTSLQLSLNDGKASKYPLNNAVLPQQLVVERPDLTKATINISEVSDNIKLYGASLESETGIYIDNFSMKGNGGFGLLSVRNEILSEFNKMLDYDLIVLQFGLNVAESKKTNYTAYAKQMEKVIKKLKLVFPKAQILIVSVSDRSEYKQGEYRTMAGIPALKEAQRQMAANTQTLFWDLFMAMGGENSMAAYVNTKPTLAHKDYTHLNYAGGRKIGLSLAASFIHEVEKYRERNKYK